MTGVPAAVATGHTDLGRAHGDTDGARAGAIKCGKDLLLGRLVALARCGVAVARVAPPPARLLLPK